MSTTTATTSESPSSYCPSRSTSSSSSSSSIEQVSKAVVQQEREQQNQPEWIEGFLKADFSVACPTHPYIANPLNRYCITCRIPGCKFCFKPGNRHSDHETFQVYSHGNPDAVLLNKMQNHMDCNDITPYRHNRSPVIALTPLPHLGGFSKFMCQTCGRRIRSPYSYCCLHCKVEAMASEPSGGASSAPPLLSDQNSPDNRENKKRVAEPESSLNRRKGKAFRAPLF